MNASRFSRIIGKCPRELVCDLVHPIMEKYEMQVLRNPATTLVMVQMRETVAGARFYLGELLASEIMSSWQAARDLRCWSAMIWIGPCMLRHWMPCGAAACRSGNRYTSPERGRTADRRGCTAENAPACGFPCAVQHPGYRRVTAMEERLYL